MIGINEASQEFYNKYHNDPAAFAQDILGSNLWSKQTEIINSVRDNMHTVVQSCYASGKSFTAAQVILWYLFTRVPSKIICTSSSWNQVEKILFSEIASAYNNSKIPMGGALLSTELRMSKDWFVIGLSPKIDAGSGEATRLEGHHSPNVFVVIDQAQGVRSQLWDVCTSLVTGDSSRILVLGNPSSPSGKYYNACKSPKWSKIKIAAIDTPNVKAGKEVIPGLVTKSWVDNQKDDWGIDNPLYITKVLAEFPAEADDVLIPLTWVERALEAEFIADGLKGIGVDVARFGNSNTVITYMHGNKVVEIESYQGKDTMRTAGRIKRMMDRYRVPDYAVCIDDSGIGGAVTDRLRDDGHKVQGVNNGSKALDDVHFANLVSELYWRLREDFEKDSIQIPNNTNLINQLPVRKYDVDSKGRIRIEHKEDMLKRGVKSPDESDSLVLARYAQTFSAKSQIGPAICVLD